LGYRRGLQIYSKGGHVLGIKFWGAGLSPETNLALAFAAEVDAHVAVPVAILNDVSKLTNAGAVGVFDFHS
jgi:hypothetical protein